MSYSVTVAVKLGEAVVTVSGDVPDGRFEISGIEDAESRELGVIQRDEHGRFVQHAASIHYKEIS